MLPTADEIIAGYPFIARRYDLPTDVNEAVVRAAVRDAHDHATDERSEPAALFFAFSRRPRAFPGAWRFVAWLVSAGHAASLGLHIRGTAKEFADLRLRVAQRKADFDAVRAWFEDRFE